MTPRDQFLADCAEVWDRSDRQPVFVFGEPGAMVGLFNGPMTTHMVGRWACFHVGHVDRDALAELVDTLAAEVLQ